VQRVPVHENVATGAGRVKRTLPMALRHRFAILIRLRQEAQKRWSRSPVPQIDVAPAEFNRFVGANAAGVPLRAMPLASHLAALDRAEFSQFGELEAELRRVHHGRTSVFGREVAVGGKDFHWRAHPESGVVAPLLPWHRQPYLHRESGGDVKSIWEINRHRVLLRLAQGWFLRREAADAELLGDLLDGWMDQNPPGWGINWTSALEVGLRAVTWCWVAALTQDAPLWTEARSRRFLWYLWHHGQHLERYDSIHHSPNTHLSGEGLALLYIGCAFPDLRRSELRWRFGLDILREEAGRQLLADGMHFERSTGYHRYTVEFLLHAISLLRIAGRSDEARSLQTAATRALGPLTQLRRPDGSVPVVGDEDGGTALALATSDPRDAAPLLSLAAGLLQLDWLQETVVSDRALAWWLLNPESFRALKARKAKESVIAAYSLPRAGYFLARETGLEPWFCLVDGGPHGGNFSGHAHDDCTHVEIARGASRLSIDPGSYSYTGDPCRREWERSAAAHATLILESRVLAVTRGPFGWAVLPPDPTTHVAEIGAHWVCRVRRSMGTERAAPVHERQTVLVRGYGVVVCDWLQGATDEPFKVTWPMPYALGEMELEDRTLGFALPARLQWEWHGVSGPRSELVPRASAPSYGRSLEGSALVLRAISGSRSAVLSIFSCPTTAPPSSVWSHEGVRLTLAETELELGPGRDPIARSRVDLATPTPG